MEYYGTLGPACGEVGILKEMLRAGMTGVRLNLSHGDLEENGHWLRLLAQAAKESGCAGSPQVLIDLRGPEVRLGKLAAAVTAEEGSRVALGAEGIWNEKNGGARSAGNRGAWSAEKRGIGSAGSPESHLVLEPVLPVPEILIARAEAGDRILVDDGKIELAVEEKAAGVITAKVLRGGVIKSEKSVAIVGKELPMPTLTESDRRNIARAAGYGVTGVMLPFVRNREDLLTLREALDAAGAGAERIRIFAKIENMRGVEAIDELLPYCDHVVIARGDLGNAMPLWRLPGVQKRLAAKCREAGKPFMIVTQMLDSMHERAVPTRAEVLDIYNAVLDGAASLMLTGETAAGRYPASAMEYLVRTGEEARYDMRSFCCRQR